jgi:hypothetical protein
VCVCVCVRVCVCVKGVESSLYRVVEVVPGTSWRNLHLHRLWLARENIGGKGGREPPWLWFGRTMPRPSGCRLWLVGP